MRRLTALFALALIGACTDDHTTVVEPVVVDGCEVETPSDSSMCQRADRVRHYSHGSWDFVTYTYRCFKGRFLTITYSRPKGCSTYRLEDFAEEEGDCDI